MLRTRDAVSTVVVVETEGSGLSIVSLIGWGLLVAALAFGATQVTGCAAAGGGGGAGAAEEDQGGQGAEPPDQPEPPDEVAREIEEADIVKYSDGYFYLANRYRGLVIIDARDIEQPAIVGRVAMQGRAVELYADDDRAYIVTSADFYRCAGKAVSFTEEQEVSALLEPDYEGSRITVVDITDPADPAKISHFDLDGFTTATRRVGEVIYAAGNFGGYSYDHLPVSVPPVATSGLTDSDDSSVEPTDEDDEDAIAPPSTTGVAVTVDETGTALATSTSPGGVTAEISLTGAVPEDVLQATVADGITRPGAFGIPDGDSLPITVTGGGDLTEGFYSALVSLQIPLAIVDEAGLAAEELAFYRYDEPLDAWLPAATSDMGDSEPTETVGDFGHYLPPDEDFHVLWAIVDVLGDFAIGRLFEQELTIQIMESEGGTVIVEPEQTAYTVGTAVTLTAQPDEGFQFVGWVSGEQSPELPASNPVQIVLTQDLEVGAVFELGEYGPQVFVVSINIADPDDIHLVDRVDLTGESLDIQVTTSAIYVLGDDPTQYGTSRVNYIDISDPQGDIQERDVFRVPGTIENRFFADEYEGVFRIVTEERGTGKVALYLYDVSNPDVVERITDLTIITGESLRSVRFDGIRGYAVTFQQIDPLFVLDLEDPANPKVTGELEVPGWSTHLVPLGDRLVGVGFDDTAGFRPAVALYDVANPEMPFQLARVVLGEKWSFDTTSEATVDEKALKVLEEDELILVPFSSYDQEEDEHVDSLQLIDLEEETLTERGFVDHRGLVRRAGVIDKRLWVLSDEAFQVANIKDRDDVVPIATEDIMSEQDLLDAGLTDCVDSARWSDFDMPFEFGWGPDWAWGGAAFEFEPHGFCGAGLIGIPLTAVALLGLRLSRGRRR